MILINKLINEWRSEPSIGGNISAWDTKPSRQAISVPFPENIHPAIRLALGKNGIHRLYHHQGLSYELTNNGHNIVLVTGTASGKTLCYNIPVLDDLLHNLQSRALYIFPTKALAQDQLMAIRNLCDTISASFKLDNPKSSIIPMTYDGDTPAKSRLIAREESRIIITNPDMLHAGIMPHHPRWAIFFQGLRYVVIDEIHIYRGVFGSHVTNILRRLKRIVNFYGGTLQFILTSATIGNPGEHAEKLIESPVKVIDNDGSARGVRHFLIYNPPIINPDLGLRASMAQESVKLASDLLDHKIQTIIFGRTRRSVEYMLTLLRSIPKLKEKYLSYPHKIIRAYRSGYLPKQRRKIEAGLRDGEIGIVVATTALELGLDIGNLSAVILAGFPGTISGTWQQAGRAGRGLATSIAILVVSAGPVDQFIAKNPDYFFNQQPEKARINPDNLLILLEHLKCAVFELPFCDSETYGKHNGGIIFDLLQHIQNTGEIHKSGDRYFWMDAGFPAAGISLRNASITRFTLHVNQDSQKETIGEVDGESANWMIHPQAIYLHEGEAFLVEDLDFGTKTASLKRVNTDYYTRPQQEIDIQFLDTFEEKPVSGGSIAHGEISVKTLVRGYYKIQWGTNEKLSFNPIILPESYLFTTAYWFKLDETIVDKLRREGNWNNDPNDYGPNWGKQRNLAKKRDECRCQVCGNLEKNQPFHVHHKIPFRDFRTHREANVLSNLTTLCPSCHLRVETAVRIRSGLAGLSYTLGNLAPLFLMCDTRDLGIFHDPKSQFNNNNPILAIFDRVPGGIGLSQSLFEIHDEILERAYQLIINCDCRDGCPSCVGPGGEFGSGSKRETTALMKKLQEY